MYLDTLNIDLMYELLKYLNGKDVIILTHVCRHLAIIFGVDKIWEQLYTREGLPTNDVRVAREVEKALEDNKTDLFHCFLRKAYILQRKLRGTVNLA